MLDFTTQTLMLSHFGHMYLILYLFYLMSHHLNSLKTKFLRIHIIHISQIKLFENNSRVRGLGARSKILTTLFILYEGRESLRVRHVRTVSNDTYT